MKITKKGFQEFKAFKMEVAGRPLVIETGKMAELCNASCLVRYGETVVLVCVAASSKPREGVDFFPLSVDFEEKLYAVGRIPGSFLRREGRPSERAVLASRLIDRPIRPLFPSDFRNDVVVTATVLAVDHDNSPEVAAMIGTSAALSISDIPWSGPIGCLNVGYVDGQIVFNPTSEQRKASQMNVTVAATASKVVMIEAGADQIPDEIMFDGICKAHEEIKRQVAFISQMVEEIGKQKFEYPHAAFDEDLYNDIMEYGLEKARYCMDTDDKNIREARLSAFQEDLTQHFIEKYPEMETYMEACMYKLQKYIVKHWLLEGKRVDGRQMDEIRPLAAEVGVLPRVHGSGLFTRGQTQVLTVATLSTISSAQKLDTIYEEESKRYMHHYNFPSYSVGEARNSRSTNRREIGHGALAERALLPVIPSMEEFPYAIRLVSEVLSSNGSTSQGSICGSTLALMDAGVPIKAPVAGISCGLIQDEGKFTTFIDIQGVEDFHGEMDFKVAGTKKGITAIQMDLKNDGLTAEIIKSALDLTRQARIQILDEIMLPCIAAPRPEVSKYAPKMIQLKIDIDKIREVIGSGGKVIQKIVADTGAKIDIEEDGTIYIAGTDSASCEAAKKAIETIVFVPEIGALYYGRVVRLMTFGAFVELAPGKDGLVHISKLAEQRVEKVEDVVKIGDMIWVKVTEIDEKGRINLSHKDAMREISAKERSEKPKSFQKK
ncbi:MAG: polyribonucleotide nucleotidyltransferase [Oscillospiraceae bacterium]|nr:polyribonucleotide nucleotidyltransferase [Oscillospiraceae bacterium]